jgi:hypothetical protein
LGLCPRTTWNFDARFEVCSIGLQPWFFEWKFGLEDWNSPYLKMAPDDLHSVYGGVLGSHLSNILDLVGSVFPVGVRKFNEVLNVRLLWRYIHHKPGNMLLPSSPTFFKLFHPVPYPQLQVESYSGSSPHDGGGPIQGGGARRPCGVGGSFGGLGGADLLSA